MFDQIRTTPTDSATACRWTIGTGFLILLAGIVIGIFRGRVNPMLIVGTVSVVSGWVRLRRIRADAEYDQRMAEALAPNKT